MDYTITVADGPKAQALTKALAAFNASNQPLNAQQFMQRLIDGQLEGLVASYLVTKIKPIDLLQRFTQDERAAIRTAAKSNATIEDYLSMLAAAQGDVDLTHPLTVAGVQQLESAGLIAVGRSAQILSL
jgi:hypothetical protein